MILNTRFEFLRALSLHVQPLRVDAVTYLPDAGMERNHEIAVNGKYDR